MTATAAPGVVTGGAPPNAVVQIQPGMNVQPVVLVDQNGNFITSSGGTAVALATTTTAVNVSAATAPTTTQVLTAVSGSAATWQALPTGGTATAGILQLDGTPSDIQPTGTAASAGNKGQAADAKHVHVQDFVGIFGDGSDGAVTLDGSTTYNTWSGLAGSTYTMTRDVFCTSLTVNAGVTLLPNNFRVFCTGAVINNGLFSADGHAGLANGTNGSSLGAQITTGGRAGGAGQTTTGSAGAASNVGSPAGGAGGAGASGSGGAGGVTQSSGTYFYRSIATAVSGSLFFQGTPYPVTGGAGGGGGGGDTTHTGGGGGGGGGVILAVAHSVTNSGTMSAGGGGGGTPATGNCGGGGGGTGGQILTYTLSAWTAGTTNVAGGVPGGGVGSGTTGTTGGVGTVLNMVLQ